MTEKNYSEIIDKISNFINEYYWIFIIWFIVWILYKIFNNWSIKVWTKDKTVTVWDVSDIDGDVSIWNDTK